MLPVYTMLTVSPAAPKLQQVVVIGATALRNDVRNVKQPTLDTIEILGAVAAHPGANIVVSLFFTSVPPDIVWSTQSASMNTQRFYTDQRKQKRKKYNCPH